jgi:hypothetical protein
VIAVCTLPADKELMKRNTSVARRCRSQVLHIIGPE